jgi:hypothetical protein
MTQNFPEEAVFNAMDNLIDHVDILTEEIGNALWRSIPTRKLSTSTFLCLPGL